MYLVNFASGEKYVEVQKHQNSLLSPCVFNIFEYGDAWLHESGFYERNKYIIEHSDTGVGFCSWKPQIILDAMNQIKDNEIIVYLDVVDHINNQSFFPWVEWNVNNELNGRFIAKHDHFYNKQYTERDCFIGMGCDNTYYWDQLIVEAGTIAFKKNNENINLLNEWASWCRMPEIICKDQNYYGQPNLPEFIEHRTDQSILSNLCYRNKYKLELVNHCQSFIWYNWFEQGMNLTKHQK